ncbi:MAG: SDR family NAD(P)-dependent oxidoreductase, partial [Acidobacteria bacterium]|nr:SDR family NAD(P)-dependent oxidoreductase [Acidobacteriota bacterium]
MTEYLRDKTVLVTGAAGSIGVALVEAILEAGAVAVRAFDSAESDLYELKEKFRGLPLAPLLGSIRELERLRFAFDGVDIVFHAAALKHVGLGEYNPFEVVQTNLVGLNNVIRAALEANVERVIFTSSDKAVNPTNVMGASKMMGERLITAANEIRGLRRTLFSSVRFGNVIGSSGSVVPTFVEQIRKEKRMLLTHPEMTRYVMSGRQATELVLEAGSLMRGGEVFVAKMRAVRIADLAKIMAEEFGPGEDVSIVHSGIRPGEKLYEELISEDELARTLETEHLLVVLPPPESGAFVKEWQPSDYHV